jgi:hypothetical protein
MMLSDCELMAKSSWKQRSACTMASFASLDTSWRRLRSGRSSSTSVQKASCLIEALFTKRRAERAGEEDGGGAAAGAGRHATL